MNDLLNDIEKLQRVTRVLSTVPFSMDIQSVQRYLRNMIEEKQKIVDNFEMECSECGHKEMGVSIWGIFL